MSTKAAEAFFIVNANNALLQDTQELNRPSSRKFPLHQEEQLHSCAASGLSELPYGTFPVSLNVVTLQS